MTQTDAKANHSLVKDFNLYIASIQIVPHSSSPHHPLLGLFNIDQKHKALPAGSNEQNRERSANTSDAPKPEPTQKFEDCEDDNDDESISEWDRMNMTSDIDAQLQIIAASGEVQGHGGLKLRRRNARCTYSCSHRGQRPGSACCGRLARCWTSPSAGHGCLCSIGIYS